ncbi:hypothetical protein [Paraglaciecola sp. 2405UD69-4]|uniref:hypothetical protein n=1 Tax=Paraglaciecola sp. 2405UD69-4 TaxID=3391836 RepID=UPI0039C9A07F
MLVTDYFEVEKCIRNGIQPDNPPLLKTYIEMTQGLVEQQPNNMAKRQVLENAMYLLLETICDTYIAQHWRRGCVDNMSKLQLCLERHCQSEHDKIENLRFRNQFVALAQYFL